MLFVYFDGTAVEWCNLRPGSDDDILRFHGGLATLVKLRGNRVWRRKGRCSLDIVDVDLLEEELNALR